MEDAMASVNKRTWTTPAGARKEAWAVRYKDRDGTYRQKTFDKKKDADKFRTTVEAEIINRGFATHIAPDTVGKVVREFMKVQDRRLDDGEIGRSRHKNIVMAVNTAILPFFKDMKMKDVTVHDVERWYEKMRKEGKSTRTARDRIRELKLILDYGERHRFCTSNPAREAMATGLRRQPTQPVRTFSREDIAALLAAVEIRRKGGRPRIHDMVRLMVHIAAFCGLRFGEIMALSRSNVLLEERILQVRHSLTEYDTIKGPKTPAGVRDVPLPPHIASMLIRWMELHYWPNDRELLFRVGTPEKPNLLSAGNFHVQQWRKLLVSAGLSCPGDELHFHALRHFAASWWIMNGMPLPDTASLLGHSKFDMTLQVYAHGIIGGLRQSEIMDNMASRLLVFERPMTQAHKLTDARMMHAAT
jgi:integrase